MEAINQVRPAVVGRAGPGPARPDRLPGRRRHDRADHRVPQAGHGHVLQGDLGVRPADRVAGQHQGGAVPGQPARERPQPCRRGRLDRQGDRPGRPARRTGLPARRHRLLADRPLRPVGAAGRLRPRHGQHRRPAQPGRGAGRGGVAAGWNAPPVTSRRPAPPGPAARTTSSGSSPNAATWTCGSTTRTSPSSTTSPASAPAPTG